MLSSLLLVLAAQNVILPCCAMPHPELKLPPGNEYKAADVRLYQRTLRDNRSPDLKAKICGDEQDNNQALCESKGVNYWNDYQRHDYRSGDETNAKIGARLSLHSNFIEKRAPPGESSQIINSSSQGNDIFMNDDVPSDEERYSESMIDEADFSTTEDVFIMDGSKKPKLNEIMTKSGVTLGFLEYSDSQDSDSDSTISEDCDVEVPSSLHEPKHDNPEFRKIAEKAKSSYKEFKNWIRKSARKGYMNSEEFSNCENDNRRCCTQNPDSGSSVTAEYFDVSCAVLPTENSDSITSDDLRIGHDTFFISDVYSNGVMALGITGDNDTSDVGGRQRFSKKLGARISEAFETSKSKSHMTPIRLVDQALLEVSAHDFDAAKARAMVAIFTPQKIVRIWKTAGSSAMLFRNGQLSYEASQRLGVSVELWEKSRLLYNEEARSWNEIDSYKTALSFEWELKKEDFIIFVSDGVSNNLSTESIEELVGEGILSSSSISNIAERIVRQASFRSHMLHPKSKIGTPNHMVEHEDMTVIMVEVK